MDIERIVHSSDEVIRSIEVYCRAELAGKLELTKKVEKSANFWQHIIDSTDSL